MHSQHQKSMMEKRSMISGASPHEAPENTVSLRLAFEHLADAVCGIGDAAGNA